MGTRQLLVFCAAGLLGAGLLGGCASGGSQPSSTPGVTVSATPPSVPPPSSAAPTPSRSPLPSGLSLPPAPTKPSQSTAEQTLTGQVEAGVEHGCLILHDSTGLYQLLGGDPTVVYAGSTVSVTGHVVVGVMSFCMQGKPFQITEAHRV